MTPSRSEVEQRLALVGEVGDLRGLETPGAALDQAGQQPGAGQAERETHGEEGEHVGQGLASRSASDG